MKTVAENLHEIVVEYSSLLNSANHRGWNIRTLPEKWSPLEIIGHLIDSANNNIQRFVRGTYEENFRIIYNQNEWVKCQHYNEADAKDLIQLWTLLNYQIVRILKNYPDERQPVKSDVGQFQPEVLSMKEIAESYLKHLNHHLDQLKI